jgi:polar amino acid transport system substrate-binding protein
MNFIFKEKKMINRKAFFFPVVFVCFLLIAGGYVMAGGNKEEVKGQNLLEKVKSSGTLRVGTWAAAQPWVFKDANDNFVGHDMDLIREIAKRMDVKVEITDMSFDALLAAVQTGKVDLAICAMGAKEERKRLVDFSQMYHQAFNAYASRSDNNITITDKEDLTKYHIGVQSGTLEEQYVNELVDAGKMKDSQVNHYEQSETMFLDLINGRYEVLAVSIDLVKTYIKRGDPLKIVWEGSIYGTGENIAVPKNQPEFLAEINRTLDVLRAEGYLAQNDEKWEL